ncbi:GDP-mannose 4,6-dehydratase [Patescibacteria group bacterium]|nr:GDP-mannose 4,6-dehydratase [Patescibacteria group bacterium]
MAKQAIFGKKNVMVIGGAGFIGSFLCDELVKEAKVICVDNFVSGREENIDHLLGNPNFIFLKFDASKPFQAGNFPELEKFKFEFQGVQEIYNLACPTIRKDFEKNIEASFLANSYLVKNSMNLAKKYNSKYLFGSTSAVYGEPLEGQTVFSEDYWGFVDFLGPRSCYNEGKRFAESMVKNLGDSWKLEYKIARIFNTYGPRMRLNSGRMIPDFVLAATENKDLTIFGDGSEINSYCFVQDIVEGLIKFMEYPEKGVLNFGNPETQTIKEIAEKIIGISNSSSRIINKEPLPFLQKPGMPDITQIKEKLGWFPIIKLEEGLQKTLDDMLAHKILHYEGGERKVADFNGNQ